MSEEKASDKKVGLAYLNPPSTTNIFNANQNKELAQPDQKK